MPKRKKTVEVEIEVPKEIVEGIGEEKLARVLEGIVSCHAKALRMMMESRKEKET